MIAFARRSLKQSERSYPAHKLEFLALKWSATEKLHDFLYGGIVTDNNPLTYVNTTAKLNSTGHRWLAALSNFNFSITYRKGKNHIDADGLSCVFPTEVIQAISHAATAETVPLSETDAAGDSSEVDDVPDGKVEETDKSTDVPDVALYAIQARRGSTVNDSLNTPRPQMKRKPPKWMSTGDWKSHPVLVAAIDFGTTYSSWAFSFQHEYDSDPTKVFAKQWKGQESQKGPTCALIEPNGKTLHAFGFDAETKYFELLEEDNDEGYFFFKRFKMRLLGQTIHRDTEIEDIQGKSLLAKTVFALSLKYLKDDLIAVTNDRISGMIKNTEIHWVLTVPAIWDDGAKQFMREAAIEAGILDDKLTIALEPEAASLFCRHLSVEKSGNQTSLAKFTAGKRYLVLDAGGGTIDVTVHEVVRQGQVKELYKASGGAWGGTKVDDAFLDFLTLITGQNVIDSFKKSDMYDFNEIMKIFEVKKRSITHESESNIVMRLPQSLSTAAQQETGKSIAELAALSKFGKEVSVVKDKLKIPASVVRTLFQKSVSTTTDHVAELLEADANKGIQAIVMVGGFSESPLLQHAIQSRFSSLKVIIPDEAGLSILKGAVIFGHSPNAITQRISKYTYGIRCKCLFNENKHPLSNKVIGEGGVAFCKNAFAKHVEAGQSLRIGDTQAEHEYIPSRSEQTIMRFPIFATKEKNPLLVTESGCFEIGKLRIPISGTGLDRKVYVQMNFGGTEIEVKGTDKATGNAVEVKVDFLS
ncbi:heat shock 70 kDa protein 12A-like [Mya arenaria]|uniref:heat shock 70 kDa protein 12A-like n=1 Tax=Mya arenaria TaxID=6604 RepID=UPI0022E15D45|nr:heat shock 70 kDa protein 12A-like [Mya arenaria]